MMLGIQKQEAANSKLDTATSGGEFEQIRKDLEALKENVGALGKHLKSEGKEKAAEARDAVGKGIDAVLDKSDRTLDMLDSSVKDNPRRALAVAFAAGVILNFLMRKA